MYVYRDGPCEGLWLLGVTNWKKKLDLHLLYTLQQYEWKKERKIK